MDRDGTIIHQVELLHKVSDVRLLPGAAQGIKVFNRLGYFTVIVTNQPVVSRGIITPADVDRIHEALLERLAKQGARIDAVYFCPHHPDSKLLEYGIVCECRKPAPGMIFQAVKEHGLDLAQSFLIGDSTRDIAAANRAGVRMVLVRTGHGGKDQWQFKGQPDFVARNLSAAAALLKQISTKRP